MTSSLLTISKAIRTIGEMHELLLSSNEENSQIAIDFHDVSIACATTPQRIIEYLDDRRISEERGLPVYVTPGTFSSVEPCHPCDVDVKSPFTIGLPRELPFELTLRKEELSLSIQQNVSGTLGAFRNVSSQLATVHAECKKVVDTVQRDVSSYEHKVNTTPLKNPVCTPAVLVSGHIQATPQKSQAKR
eukprot:PhF_6_TR36819/c0_g1_i1/m.54125